MRPTVMGGGFLAPASRSGKAERGNGERDTSAAAELNMPMDVPRERNTDPDATVARSSVSEPLADPAAQPPVLVVHPAAQTTPLIFASSHSGRKYSPEFLAASRLDPLGLRRSEDSFVDELFSAAATFGAPLVHATFPRAWCDPNREPWELDPAMFVDELPSWVNTSSPRVGAGLGTIARVVASGESIYRDKITFAEAERRIETCWKPFHETVAALVESTRARFGQCVLIDCHSMPSNVPASGRGERLADIVLGDAHGTACAPRLIRFVERRLIDLGYRVRRNDPYAGGYITRHYGQPRDHVHALQIEIARDLYMDEGRFVRSSRFPWVQYDLSQLIKALATDLARSVKD